MKSNHILLLIILCMFLMGCSNPIIFSEADARAIAEETCIKGGEALGPGSYNENTKTWWFDANLNSAREGCNPACVVSEETKTAEINWRCTGLIPPQERCGIENCHGMDIVCGPNVAEICDMMYQAGDSCRHFASCKMIDGECKLEKSPGFEECKACVEKCESDFKDNPERFFECESRCAG